MRFLWPLGSSFFTSRSPSPPAETSTTKSPGPSDDAFDLDKNPLPRENDFARERSALLSPAVSAVMLGVMGIGTLTGVSLVHADTLNPPTPDPNDVDPTIRDAAAALDGARESMSAEELARARNELWRSFVSRAAPPPAPVNVPLTGGVGPGLQNKPEDLASIRARLADLGFPTGTSGRWDRATERGLRLFEAIVTGREGIAGTTGRVQPGSALHDALSASDAPRWVKMPSSGPGFVNNDIDGYSYGVDRLAAVVADAASHYETGYRTANPDSALISLNDASRRDGGPNRDHETHEVGLDLDIRLPRKDGTSGSDVRWRDYDRNATRAIIEAFARDPRVERVLTSDRTLLREISRGNAPWKDKVVYGGAQHRNHLHIDVAPPEATR